jgi:hypothetical protein
MTDTPRVYTHVGKLAGFSALLVVLFGGAAFAGGAIGPDRDGERPAASHRGDHEAVATDADAVRGLAVSDDGVTLALQQAELPRDRAAELRFAIVDGGGRRVRDFEVEHEKRMHLIVVRRDGHGFQHLHPRLGADGIWRTRVTLPDAGAYRVFADFKRGGTARTLGADLTVDGQAEYEPLPVPAATARTGDGYEVRLDAGRVRAGNDAELRFSVSRDGETVHTEPYLGAGGHLVALRQGDLAYLHVHPGGHDAADAHDDAVAFASEFPSAGRYRLYLQFKHEGSVHTAEFTQEVVR